MNLKYLTIRKTTKFFIARWLLILGIGLCLYIYLNKNELTSVKALITVLTPIPFILSLYLFLIGLGENSLDVDLTQEGNKYEIKNVKSVDKKGIIYLCFLLFLLPMSLFAFSYYKGYPFYDIFYIYILLAPGYKVLFDKLHKKAP